MKDGCGGAGRLLIVDTVAPGPYSERSLRAGGLGGTEATVIRIAVELVRDRPVTIAQRSRREREVGSSGVEYSGYCHKDHQPLADVDAVVVVRAHKLLPRLRRRYPSARMFLWMHCLPGRRLRPLARACVATDTTLIGVSQFHEQAMQAFYHRHDPPAAAELDTTFVYNPIDDDLTHDHSEHDPDKLLFLSSPHKGLEEVIEAFSWLRERIPTLRLHLANPGYLERELPRVDGVEKLGVLPHAGAIDHLRSSLCLFYPQQSFAETFGLVFAEAMAVGTPVIAHPVGAATEVVGDAEQIFDVSDRARILERIQRWRRGERPSPVLPAAFRLHQVVQDWRELLRAPRSWSRSSREPASDPGLPMQSEVAVHG